MKTIATTIALSALAATGAPANGTAEEQQRMRMVPVADVAPGLAHFTDDVLFGNVWLRPHLAARDRSLVTVAALVATGSTAQLAGHVGRALDNGVEPHEIGELITHLAFYTGWPNAMSAVAETRNVFAARGIAAIGERDAKRVVPDEAAEVRRRRAVDATVAPTAPALAALTNDVLFGDLWTRPDLAPRDRSLVTMAALIAIGQPEQLPFHAERAMDNGLTETEAAEVVTHLGFYAGWPRAMSAVPVLEKVLASRHQKKAEAMSDTPNTEIALTRAGTDPKAGPEAYFTGDVQISAPYKGTPPARISGATVSFPAGARTAWHTHPLGQTLYIVSGKGWVQKEGGRREAFGAGDVVWIPPLVKHWHGAAADTPMVHFAVAEALDGSVVTWLDKVTDAQYTGDPARD
ncbi:carboxymuconolactone decarboxylase [Rhizobium sp. Leaf384]|uniref:(R)-mandelonitrile lyase n=1 Tax=unclassified Rhizobium TaxID=2613769 RepID=UPI0007158731|nr:MULTISPECIES: carboxymuconolactone decarboxylase family protein [unclassified Rhizobium]KQS74079.1 carboxymuconolactone decarboxylase [Rhizobium sp. Leaf384]KQS84780.1 carboxymuconolactone decarboxylase [Rhizobium sp. Leaf383]